MNLVGIEFLMSRWSTETHTFMAVQLSPLLEDVAMLMSLPFVGEAHATVVTLN